MHSRDKIFRRHAARNRWPGEGVHRSGEASTGRCRYSYDAAHEAGEYHYEL